MNHPGTAQCHGRRQDQASRLPGGLQDEAVPRAGATTIELRRSQAVHERAGLASYEPEHDPEGLTVEAAIELAAWLAQPKLDLKPADFSG